MSDKCESADAYASVIGPCGLRNHILWCADIKVLFINTDADDMRHLGVEAQDLLVATVCSVLIYKYSISPISVKHSTEVSLQLQRLWRFV